MTIWNGWPREKPPKTHNRPSTSPERFSRCSRPRRRTAAQCKAEDGASRRRGFRRYAEYHFGSTEANPYQPLAAPFGGSAAIAAKGVSLVTLRCYHSTNSTPSVSPFGLPAPPSGSRGIVRIRPGFHEAITAYRNPPAAAAAAQLCMKQLYAVLWSATPAKPFRGAFGWETLQGGEYGKDIGFDHRQDAAGI